MRKIFMLLGAMLLFLPVRSEVAIGRKTSELAYRYELPAEVLKQLIDGNLDSVPASVLINPLASCPVSAVDTISSGHGRWVWAWMEGTRLHFRIENNPAFKAFVYGETDGIVAVKVVNRTAETITDATVTLGGKRLKYNARTLCYEGKAPKKSTVLCVEYKGDIKGYDIKKHVDYSSYRPYYSNVGKIKGQSPYEFSYVVTDKPKYRPNDTLRWKAVIINRDGRWQNGEFELWIEPQYSSEGKRVGVVAPIYPGVYGGEIFLTDSFDLSANSSYHLVLRDKKGSTSAWFNFEDYNLKSLKVTLDAAFEARRGEPFKISVRATDEKGDAMTDGTIKLEVRSSHVSYSADDKVFVPGKLYSTNVALSPTGKTELIIPTSHFPAVNMGVSYTVEVNSAVYETVKQYGYFTYNHKDAKPQTPDEPFLGVETYDVADSVGFKVVNPGGEQFRYAIYRDGKVIESASVRELDWRISEPKNATYTIAVSHKNSNLLRSIEHNANGLRLHVEQPKVLQPGTDADILVRVIDGKGNPVEDADVTAFSYTSKFGSRFFDPKSWPYGGKKIEYPYSLVVKERRFAMNKSSYCPRDLEKIFGVDKLLYHQLLTQKNFMCCKPDSVTQIAPFVVKNGELQPIEIVYIDSRPVYIGWATNARPYSFRVASGCHTVTLRTADAQYVIRNVEVKKNHKTWLSVQARDTKTRGIIDDGRVKSSRMPDFLTDTEAAFFRRHAEMHYRVYPNIGFPYIKFGDDVIDLTTAGNPYANSGVALVPDVTGLYHETDSIGRTIGMQWKYVPDSRMDLYPQENLIITVGNAAKEKSKRKLHNSAIPSTDDAVLTESELMARWIEHIDNRRRNYYFPNNQQHGNCTLMLLADDEAEMPLNIIIKSDSSVIYEGNRRYFHGLCEREYTVMFLYKGALCAEQKIQLRPDGFNCMKICSDHLRVTPESRALEAKICRMVEARSVNYYGGAVEYSETEVAYGAAPTGGRRYKGTTRTLSEAVPSMAVMKSTVMTDNAVVEEMAVVEEDAADDEVFMFTEEAMDEGEAVVETLRSEFSEVAYWRPDLRTDKNGEVRFTVHYPDDLTRWNEYFVAFKGRQRGSAHTEVVTRKDLVAMLAVPMFAVEGDSVEVIGRSVNYSADTVSVFYRNFEVDGKRVSTLSPTALRPSVADYQYVSASEPGDSVCVTYLLSGADLFDGEQRYIPVYQKGMQAVEAEFYLLESGDTAVTFVPDRALGNVELRVQSDLLSLLMTVSDDIVRSELTTNDMLASRLTALLSIRQSALFRGEKFKQDAEVKNIIRKLSSNCKTDGLWAWTGRDGVSQLWVSAHVYRALVRASALGYEVNLLYNSEVTVRELMQRALNYKKDSEQSLRLQLIEIVSLLGYTNETRTLLAEVRVGALAGNDLLRYNLLAARCGVDVSLVCLDSIRRDDIFGGECYAFKPTIMPLAKIYYDPEYYTMETTMLVYRLWEIMPMSADRDKHLKAIRRWLLRCQRGGRWFNHCKSAEVVDMLMPQCLSEEKKWHASNVVVRQGDRVVTLSKFPCQASFDPAEPITIEKSGTSEVYVSAVQRYWQRDVKPRESEFSVNTNLKTSNLRCGEEAVLEVTVRVTKDAEYVMINVPIPAGCTYADHQPRTFGEVHREQLRNAVNIYCERMTTGVHRFEIRLMPRFAGRYTQNPSRVEMVYFPVFNANSAGHSVDIIRK